MAIGKEGVSLTHLQYADDVIFFGNWCVNNIKNLLKFLHCFQAASGLKINIGKSKLYGVGVGSEEAQSWASSLGCSDGELPFTYLGLPVGREMNKIESWKEVIKKMENKLATWKAKMISIGGRLTLVRSVLGSLPLYFFSFFRVPRGVIRELESVRSRFF